MTYKIVGGFKVARDQVSNFYPGTLFKNNALSGVQLAQYLSRKATSKYTLAIAHGSIYIIRISLFIDKNFHFCEEVFVKEEDMKKRFKELDEWKNGTKVK